MSGDEAVADMRFHLRGYLRGVRAWVTSVCSALELNPPYRMLCYNIAAVVRMEQKLSCEVEGGMGLKSCMASPGRAGTADRF